MALRLVAFDMDGVIYRGATLLPQVGPALQGVLDRGLLLRYVTNNSSQHRSTVAVRLAGFGLPSSPDMILTSGAAAALWMVEQVGRGSEVLVIGGDGLVEELREVGLSPLHAVHMLAEANGGVAALPGSPESVEAAMHVTHALTAAPPAAVVVGLDRSFTYGTLCLGQAAVMAGALFVATNTDSTFPAEGRLLPGGGSLVAAVATASGRQPVVIGKPEREMADQLARSAGVEAREVLFVGDRLDTDIRWARRAGMHSALVLTGVSQAADVERARHEGREEDVPEYVLRDLSELAGLLDGLQG